VRPRSTAATSSVSDSPLNPIGWLESAANLLKGEGSGNDTKSAAERNES
jgi:hypothetical protein